MKILRIFLLIIVFLFLSTIFQGCSLKSPKNQWEYNSANAFNSYTKSFLSSQNELAKDDLKRAIKYAKQSANLEQLARIYIGVCALNNSVGIKDTCNKYTQIKELINSLEIEAYYLMLRNEVVQLQYLPKQYQAFLKYKIEKKYELAFKTIKHMEQETSQFIAASLIKEQLKESDINYLIQKASFYGYKKIVLFWLQNLFKLYEKENNEEKKELILKKIMILKE